MNSTIQSNNGYNYAVILM